MKLSKWFKVAAHQWEGRLGSMSHRQLLDKADEVAQLEDSEEYWHREANEQMGLKLKALAEVKRLQEVIDELTKILDGYGHWKEGDDVAE